MVLLWFSPMAMAETYSIEFLDRELQGQRSPLTVVKRSSFRSSQTVPSNALRRREQNLDYTKPRPCRSNKAFDTMRAWSYEAVKTEMKTERRTRLDATMLSPAMSSASALWIPALSMVARGHWLESVEQRWIENNNNNNNKFLWFFERKQNPKFFIYKISLKKFFFFPFRLQPH